MPGPREREKEKRDWAVTAVWFLVPFAALIAYKLAGDRWLAGLGVFVISFVLFAVWAQRTGRLDRMP